jgi:hypothetical protein
MTTGEERTDALVKAGQDKKHWYAVELDDSLMPKPRNLAEMFFVCEFFAVNGMAPKGLDTPRKMMAAWIYGKQLGFDFWGSLRNIAVINNRASVYGPAVLGLVRKSGKLEKIKEWKEGSGKAMTAYCEVKRKDDGTVYLGEFSMEDAELAGLLDKKSPWQTYPKDMLKYKARARALYDAFSDVLENVTMYEEAIDYEEAEVVPESAFDDMPPPSPPQKEATAAPEPEPEPPGQDMSEPEEIEPEPEEEPEEIEPEEDAPVDTKPEEVEPETDQGEVVDAEWPPDEGQGDQDDEGGLSKFDALLIAEKPDPLLRLAVEFVLKQVADFHKMEIDDVKDSAASQWKNFWKNVQDYVEKNRNELKQHLESEGDEDQGDVLNWWEHREYWIYSRGNGFKRLVEGHLDELMKMPPEFITEILNKWERITEDLGPFPLQPTIENNRIAGYERRPETQEDIQF